MTGPDADPTSPAELGASPSDAASDRGAPEPAPDITPDASPDAASPEDTLLLDDLRVVFERHGDEMAAARGRATRLEGQQIGRYLVGRELGHGGMASVHRAVDRETGRDVAVKVLRPQYQADRDIAARFEREAQSMARIVHDHVVRILGFAGGEDIRAIVMELMPGGSLRDRLAAHVRGVPPIAVADAAEWIAQSADGCAAAHALGIVHRDIKPSNLLLDGEGRVKVADFGAILVMEGATWLTGVGQQIGTPGYMSPEQCRGERVTPASDIYSLGATLYELLTGRLPFEVEEASPFAMMLKHLSDPPPDPRALRPDVPEWLAGLLQRCMAKDPVDRFTGATALADALRSALRQAAPEPAAARERRTTSRIDVPAVRRQLQQLPHRAIVAWACRCARRVQPLNPDARLERTLAMAEAIAADATPPNGTHSLDRVLSRIRSLRAASLTAVSARNDPSLSRAAAEAANAAAAASACAAARCIDDAAADAAFAARSAMAALRHAGQSTRSFWDAARRDFQALLHAELGPAGTIGRPVPAGLLEST